MPRFEGYIKARLRFGTAKDNSLSITSTATWAADESSMEGL